MVDLLFDSRKLPERLICQGGTEAKNKSFLIRALRLKLLFFDP